MKHKKLLKISLISLAVIVVGLLVIPGPVKDITQNKYHEYRFHKLLANGDKNLKENSSGPFVYILLNSDEPVNSKVMQYKHGNPVGVLELDGKYDYINFDKLGENGANLIATTKIKKVSKVINLKDDTLETVEYIEKNIPEVYDNGEGLLQKDNEYLGQNVRYIGGYQNRTSHFLEMGKDENGIKFEISDFANSFNAGENDYGENKYDKYKFNKILRKGDKDLKINLYGPFDFLLLNSEDSSNSKIMQYRNGNPVGLLELDGKYDTIHWNADGQNGGTLIVSNNIQKESKSVNLNEDTLEDTEYIEENIPKIYTNGEGLLQKDYSYLGSDMTSFYQDRFSPFLARGNDKKRVEFTITDFVHTW